MTKVRFVFEYEKLHNEEELNTKLANFSNVVENEILELPYQFSTEYKLVHASCITDQILITNNATFRVNFPEILTEKFEKYATIKKVEMTWEALVVYAIVPKKSTNNKTLEIARSLF